MKKSILFLLLIVGPRCSPDDGLHRTIYFENNADYTIYVSHSTHFPDTLFDPAIYRDILPHTLKYYDEKIGFENVIAKNKDGKIIIFVKRDEPYVIVKRYILTLDSLNKLEWKVSYP